MSIPDGTGHAAAARNDNERLTPLTRRSAVVALLQCGIVAHAFGCRQLAAGPFQTESQPLLAAVGRLVDAMAYLGEPFARQTSARLRRRGQEKTRRARSRKSSGSSTRVAWSAFASIRRAASRSSAAPPRRGWSSRGGAHSWSRCGTKRASPAGSTSRARRRGRSTGRDRARRWRRQSCARPTSSTAGSRSRCSTRSRWSRSSPDSSSSTASCCSTAATAAAARRSSAPSLGAGSEDIGFRNRVAVLFDVAPSRDVTLRVRDEHGRPRMASFVVQGPGRPRLSGAIEAARAGFLLPGAGLSRRRRDGAAAGRRVHGDVRARAGVHARNARRARSAIRGRVARLPAAAVDRSRGAAAGIRAIITSTPPAAATTRARPRACGRKT